MSSVDVRELGLISSPLSHCSLISVVPLWLHYLACVFLVSGSLVLTIGGLFVGGSD